MATIALSELRKQREAVVEAHLQAEAVDHDAAATVATFARPRYEVPAAGATVDGAEGVRAFVEQVLTSFPDLWVRQKTLYHADNAVVVEGECGGTQRGVWAGVAPTGKRWQAECALIFIFEGSDLVCEKVYFDNATILRQLGALS
jgi:predicted ester cyclase